MKSEHLLAFNLKEMMKNDSLENITVPELAKKCGISVKTFYYHYHDIYDLLTQVFLNEEIKGIKESENINQVSDLVWNYYQENIKFIDAAIQSAGYDLFIELIYNNFYISFLRFINGYKNGEKINDVERKSIARFFAFGYSNAIAYYLSNFKKKNYEGFCNCISFVNEENFNLAIKQAIEKRGN